jgi:hypothetical protein
VYFTRGREWRWQLRYPEGISKRRWIYFTKGRECRWQLRYPAGIIKTRWVYFTKGRGVVVAKQTRGCLAIYILEETEGKKKN